MNKTVSSKSEQEKNLFLCAARGLAAAVIVAVIAAVISCLISLSFDDPDKYVKVFSLISLFISCGAGGHITARAKGKNAFLCGLTLGIMVIGLIAALSLSLSLAINMTLFAICVPCTIVTSILGAVTGVDKQKKSRPRKKRKF